MSKLSALVEQIEATTKTANTNLDDVHPNTRGGWASAIIEAKERLKGLQKEYGAQLLRSGVAIFVEGDSTKSVELAGLVRDEKEGLYVFADALYMRLAADIEPTLSEARTWGIAQTHKLHLMLKEVGHELALSEIPMPTAVLDTTFRDHQALVEHIRTTIHKDIGDDLNRLYMERQIIEQATKIRYSNDVTPVLILKATDDEAPTLAKSLARGMTKLKITEEDKVDKDFMITAFKQVNKTIRKKQS